MSISRGLSILAGEEELIIKPFQLGLTNNNGAVEIGKIVSRVNKPLFDYQIGATADTSILNLIFGQKILLLDPNTKEVIFEMYQSRLPLLCRTCCQQNVRCLATGSDETQLIGSIRQGLAFVKIWYDVYDNRREHVASLMLRKNHLKSKIQHRIPEFEIFDSDQTTNIGRIYPFSTDLECSEYGQAAALKIPQDMRVEVKATLLISALFLKSRLH